MRDEEMLIQVMEDVTELFELQARNLDQVGVLWQNQEMLLENQHILRTHINELQNFMHYWIDNFKKVLDFPEAND